MPSDENSPNNNIEIPTKDKSQVGSPMASPQALSFTSKKRWHWVVAPMLAVVGFVGFWFWFTRGWNTEFVLKEPGFFDSYEPFTKGGGTMRVTEQPTGRCRAEGQVEVSRQPDGTYKEHMWAHGVTHIWVGKCSVGDYVFDGSRWSPLTFRVDKDKGYTYVKGRGTVTMPDGKSIRLPR